MLWYSVWSSGLKAIQEIDEISHIAFASPMPFLLMNFVGIVYFLVMFFRILDVSYDFEFWLFGVVIVHDAGKDLIFRKLIVPLVIQDVIE